MYTWKNELSIKNIDITINNKKHKNINGILEFKCLYPSIKKLNFKIKDTKYIKKLKKRKLKLIII